MDGSRLRFIAAPMVGQSDLPFRILARKHGATLAYTQMLIPERLLNDQEYLEHHLKDLSTTASGLEQPVVAQLCGNDPEIVVRAGRKLQSHCQGIDLNLGCPQEHARDGHFGAYLLSQSDWPLVESIVSSMTESFVVPVSVKLRLCQPASKTLDLSRRLEGCGVSWVTLHARTVSARRRRQGAADLNEVKRLKENLSIPIISNGNVRNHSDLWTNLALTGADGLMVGETLLGNPCIFTERVPDPVDISLEYLSLCDRYPETASLKVIQTHIRHFIEFQWCGVLLRASKVETFFTAKFFSRRRPWFTKFRAALAATKTVEGIEHLVSSRVEKWRGRTPRNIREMDGEDSDDETPGGESDHLAEDFMDLSFFK